MIIEKLIAVWPRRRSRTKQTLGDLSTPPPSQPTSVHPVCDYFFLISPPYPLTFKTNHHPPVVSFFYFYFTPVNIRPLNVYLVYVITIQNTKEKLFYVFGISIMRFLSKSHVIPYAFDLDLGVENVVGYNISYTIYTTVSTYIFRI